MEIFILMLNTGKEIIVCLSVRAAIAFHDQMCGVAYASRRNFKSYMSCWWRNNATLDSAMQSLLIIVAYDGAGRGNIQKFCSNKDFIPDLQACSSFTCAWSWETTEKCMPWCVTFVFMIPAMPRKITYEMEARKPDNILR